MHVQWRQHVHTLYAEPCSSTLCSNGGHCSDVVIAGVETFSCNCTPGWAGPTCSEDIDFCASQPCMHGGTCIDTGDGYTCNCSGSYTGPSCADIDHCAVYSPCQNGQCVNTADTYSCICVTGWTGKNCTNDVDECLQLNTCQNGGNCSNVDGTYSCSCTPSYTGVNCEESMPCISDPCDPAPSRTASFGVPWSISRLIDISLIASICCISLVVLIIFSVSVIVVVVICCTKSLRWGRGMLIFVIMLLLSLLVYFLLDVVKEDGCLTVICPKMRSCNQLHVNDVCCISRCRLLDSLWQSIMIPCFYVCIHSRKI